MRCTGSHPEGHFLGPIPCTGNDHCHLVRDRHPGFLCPEIKYGHCERNLQGFWETYVTGYQKFVEGKQPTIIGTYEELVRRPEAFLKRFSEMTKTPMKENPKLLFKRSVKDHGVSHGYEDARVKLQDRTYLEDFMFPGGHLIIKDVCSSLLRVGGFAQRTYLEDCRQDLYHIRQWEDAHVGDNSNEDLGDDSKLDATEKRSSAEAWATFYQRRLDQQHHKEGKAIEEPQDKAIEEAH